jgi:hypothetical protein
VHFRIEANGYKYPSFHFTEEDKKAFYTEVSEALKPLGWNTKTDKEWNCIDIVNGKSHLYLHPQDFSGEVLKNDIKAIAEALQEHNTFYLEWVDLYETVYDMSDDDYCKYLDSKKSEIRTSLYRDFGTTRTNKYYSVYNVCCSLTGKYGLKRVNKNDGLNYGNGYAMQYIAEIIKEMITEGSLAGAEFNNTNYVRSLNKAEQKKLKINVV